LIAALEKNSGREITLDYRSFPRNCGYHPGKRLKSGKPVTNPFGYQTPANGRKIAASYSISSLK
jgi:hypothetical protein